MAIQPLANPNVVAHWPTDSFKDRLIAPEILNQALEGTPKHTNADGSELEARTPLAVFTRGRALVYTIIYCSGPYFSPVVVGGSLEKLM